MLENSTPIKVKGLVLVRCRTISVDVICFMTIEDETGFANLVIFQKLFDTLHKEILRSKLIMVEGTLQVEGAVIHVIVKRCFDFTKLLSHLTPSQTDNPQFSTLARLDKNSIPPPQNKRAQVRDNMQEIIFPQSRDFK